MSTTDPHTEEISHRKAIAIAKAHVRDVFAEEGISEPSLEEVWFDDSKGDWFVTVGFTYRDPLKARPKLRRDFSAEYRTVRISGKDGHPRSVKLRDSAA